MRRYSAILLVLFLFVLVASAGLSAQDWIRTGTGLGVEKIRLAAPDFKLVATDTGTQNLATTFNTTLGNDLQAAGIFDMVSRSFYPMSIPGAPQDVHLSRLEQPAAERQYAGLWQPWCPGRISQRPGLAVRHQEPAIAAGSGQAVSRAGERRQRAADRAPLCRRDHLSSWAAACKGSPRPSSISSVRAAARRKSGRWITTAPARSN